MANSLYLDILNLTVGEDGTTSSGFKTSEIYLIIQGRIDSGDGAYAHLNWDSGKLTAMSLSDNTFTVDTLGSDQNIKYAPYWITLEKLMTKSSFDADKGIIIPTPIYSGRLYISFLNPVYINIALSSKGEISPAEPDEGNPADPNFHTIWDKFEFTANTENVLYSNTTCVDFVGIPMSFSVDGSETPTEGFHFDDTSIQDPYTTICKDFNSDADFSSLVGTSRLFAPKVNSDAFSPFGNNGTYMNPYISFCWAHYFSNTDPIEIWNFVDITVDENDSLKDNANGKGCKWIAQGTMKNGDTNGSGGTLIFTISKLLAKDNTELTPPSMTFEISKPSSWDTMRQGGVFAPDPALKGYLQAIDGDIKNQVSTAINRNVMHGTHIGPYDDTNPSKGTIWWANRMAFYEDNNVPSNSLRINKYGKFLHALSINKLCYALAYDDKYSRNVNLNANLDPNCPTIMKLMVYYKKIDTTGGKKPEASMDVEDLLGNEYTIKVVADPDNQADIIISVNPKNGDSLTNCSLMFPRNISDQQSFNKYFPATAKDNAVKIPAINLVGGFKFVFRFEIIGDEVDGRQYLLPSNADAPNGNVYLYDFTTPDTPLSTAEIQNLPTT